MFFPMNCTLPFLTVGFTWKKGPLVIVERAVLANKAAVTKRERIAAPPEAQELTTVSTGGQYSDCRTSYHRWLAKTFRSGGCLNTPWEAVALAAGVELPHLLGAALLARQDDATTRANLLAICHAPDLMKKRVEYAMLPGGWRDRDALHKFVGLL